MYRKAGAVVDWAYDAEFSAHEHSAKQDISEKQLKFQIFKRH